MRKVIQALKNHKKLTIILYTVAFLGLFLTFSSHAVFAETVDYNVNVNPSLKISLSSNPIVLNLNPNSKPFGTANVDITVGTNNMYGYKLFMTTDSNTTDLVRDNSADSVAATIPTLANTGNPCTTSYNNSTFTTNSRGYRINNNVGGETNCIDTTNTNYYSYTPGTLISSATTATNEQTATLTFASKIDYLKPAGQYALTLKMSALPIVTTYYMQDIAVDPTLAASVCTEEPTVVLDKRDEQAYTIRRINGTCWMVENLKFTGTTMDSTTSNIAPEYTPSNPLALAYEDLVTQGVTNGRCFGTYNETTIAGSGDGYTYPCIHEADISITGDPLTETSAKTVHTVWYNYAAASVTSTVGLNNSNPTEYDICPKGWKMPTNAQNTALVSAIGSSPASFNPNYAGRYQNGVYYASSTYGYWWSTSTYNGYRRKYLLYGNNSLSLLDATRYNGFTVRCVLDNFGINDLSNMQDFASVAESDAATGDNKKQQVLDSMVTNTAYSLADSRDTQIYNIKKLGDDNIWMTRNLAVGCNGSGSNYGSTATSKSLTSANSNLINAYSTPTATLNGVTNQTNLYNNSYMTCSNNYGAWYNFVTASAGTIKGATNSSNASYDICPTGWQLPPKSTIDSFVSTVPAADGQTVLSPQFGGFYSGGGAVGSTNYGIWWSSTRMNDTAMEALTTNSGGYIGTGGAASRYYGFYIRCVAK